MRNLITVISLVICLIGQSDSALAGPGIFNFSNNTACTVNVVVYAYFGGCGGIDTASGIQGNTGSVAVPPHSTVNVASGYSGGGDVWGLVVAT